MAFKSGLLLNCGCPGDAGRCTIPIIGFADLKIVDNSMLMA
jgi:hypothetical protein